MSPLNRPAVLLLAALAPLAVAVAAKDGFTDQFPIAACDFQTLGGNSYLRLLPGRQLYLNNRRCVNGRDLAVNDLDQTIFNRRSVDGQDPTGAEALR